MSQYTDHLEYVNRYASITDEDVPMVPNLDAVMLKTLIKHAKANTNGLEMGDWHFALPGGVNETNWCKTTHCRAGYAVCLAGSAGWKLEGKSDPEDAGALIYLKSVGHKPTFYTSDQEALQNIIMHSVEQGFTPTDADLHILSLKYDISIQRAKDNIKDITARKLRKGDI